MSRAPEGGGWWLRSERSERLETPARRVVSIPGVSWLGCASHLDHRPVPAPTGEVLHSSAPLDADGRVPTDVTVWVRA